MSEKTISEKLLLKPGRSLFLVNEPESYFNSIGELPPFARQAESAEKADVILLFVRNLAELANLLEEVTRRLQENKVFWVSYPKKAGKFISDLDRDHVNLYLATKGWQGMELIALDDDWTAMRVKRK